MTFDEQNRAHRERNGALILLILRHSEFSASRITSGKELANGVIESALYRFRRFHRQRCEVCADESVLNAIVARGWRAIANRRSIENRIEKAVFSGRRIPRPRDGAERNAKISQIRWASAARVMQTARGVTAF
jgi:hypothetical protein